MVNTPSIAPDEWVRWEAATALLRCTLPWTVTGDALSPEHPWADIWDKDGDLLIQVGEALAEDVDHESLAHAIVTAVTAFLQLLDQARPAAARLLTPPEDT